VVEAADDWVGELHSAVPELGDGSAGPGSGQRELAPVRCLMVGRAVAESRVARRGWRQKGGNLSPVCTLYSCARRWTVAAQATGRAVAAAKLWAWQNSGGRCLKAGACCWAL
jgi:hypothetical protein